MNTEFNIPKTWKVVTFEDVSEGKNAIVDGPFGSNLKTSDYIEDKLNGVPVLTTKNLEGDYSDDKVRFISKDKFETLKRSQVNPGDILVAKIGSIGKTGIYPKNARTAIIPANLLKFTVSKNVNFNYVFYYLNSRGLQNRIKKIATATAQPAFNVTKFRKLRIPLPPLPEQQAIVAKIEELLSDLENGKQQLQTAQQQLKVYRQSLLKWAFEGKLTNKKVKDGELPKGWKWVKNKELLKYVTSGSRDWKQYYSTKGSRFVRTQDINSNKLNIENAAFVDLPEKVEGKRSLIEEGDILMIITGAYVGKAAVIDFPIKDAYVSQSVALLKYQDKRISKYLWYYFQATGFGKTFIEKLVYGVGRPVLSLENMREVDVLICPIEDQQQIIGELESKLTVCDKIEDTISHSLQQAETLRQSILKKAFEGKLIKE
jgi:type I restriction enzyme, S subunit